MGRYVPQTPVAPPVQEIGDWKRFVCVCAVQADGSTSLLRAARSGNVDRVVDLLATGKIDINACNAVGPPALQARLFIYLFVYFIHSFIRFISGSKAHKTTDKSNDIKALLVCCVYLFIYVYSFIYLFLSTYLLIYLICFIYLFS